MKFIGRLSVVHFEVEFARFTNLLTHLSEMAKQPAEISIGADWLI
jgi:hypothetical protein